MIEPIALENENFLIHSFRSIDLKHLDVLAREVFNILSDEHTLRYLPAKRLESSEQAAQFLLGMLLNFHSGRNYLHFIRDKDNNKVIGMIDLISPEMAREHYRMERYPYFLEFYLSSKVTGSLLMTELLPKAVDQLLERGIAHIGAVVNRNNIAAQKVLKKARFKKRQAFDHHQDLYEINLS